MHVLLIDHNARLSTIYVNGLNTNVVAYKGYPIDNYVRSSEDINSLTYEAMKDEYTVNFITIKY